MKPATKLAIADAAIAWIEADRARREARAAFSEAFSQAMLDAAQSDGQYEDACRATDELYVRRKRTALEAAALRRRLGLLVRSRRRR